MVGPVRGATSGPGDGQEVLDDRALLAAHVAGDPDAFGTLFRRHRDRLWAVALRTLGDPEEAADALQDGLVSAFRRADSYRGEAAVTTWLHRIVVNACLDRARRRKVRAADPLPGSPHEGLEENGPSAAGASGIGAREALDPADVALDRERRDLVLRALDTLPVEQRAALVLVDMEGYSVEEAARMLDCAAGTVKSRCSRGRARLAPELERLGLHASGGRPREPGAAGSRPSTRHETGGEQT